MQSTNNSKDIDNLVMIAITLNIAPKQVNRTYSGAKNKIFRVNSA